ncbi:MAG: PrsW family intramembrane metalloprotease [Halobacteriota archaeon]
MSGGARATDFDPEETVGRHVHGAPVHERHHLHGVRTWEPQTAVDRLLVDVYAALHSNVRVLAFAALTLVLLANVSVGLVGLYVNPVVGAFTLASVLPAAFVAFYVWDSDPLGRQSAFLVAATFGLGIVVVGFAYILNTWALPYFEALPAFGLALFFLLFVAPLEETLKLLAVYVYPMESEFFGTAIDGAVFGAFAGLGFATAENAFYIVSGGFFGPTGVYETIVGRAGVAPAHVLWSSIAGYYLGLARLNPAYAGAIVFKGLLLAVGLHGVYNVGVSYLPATAEALDISGSASNQLLTLGFLLVFYATVWITLERLIARYRRVEKEYALLDG